MTRTLLVVPTGHGVGLTATSLGLVRALDQLGINVGFVKPLAQARRHSTGPERSTALINLTTNLKPPEPIAASLVCLLYTSPSPRDQRGSRMPSSA